jgi:hypothetical protein
MSNACHLTMFFETVKRAQNVNINLNSITSLLEFIEIESACHYSGTTIFHETPCTKSDNFK